MDKDEILANELLARQITLFRFTAGERARVLRILKRMEEDLIDLLFYSGKPLTDIGRADKARLLKQAQDTIRDSYGETADTVAANLADLGRIEAHATASAFETAFQGAVVPALPTEVFFKHLVNDTLIQGAPSADWWARQAGDVQMRFKMEVAQGLAQAETNAQIIARVRSGPMAIARNNAAAQVQTSVQTVANTARRETFAANEDIVKGIRQVSTLDGHTTPTCVAYSGAGWSIPGYKPIAPNSLPYNGGTPRHWNCRSLEVPITRTFKELGIDLPEFGETTRSAHGGPFDAKASFAQFLDSKPKSFADDLLGPGRAQLWRDGKITLQQLLDQQGRPLTLAQLRKLYDN